MSDDVGIIYQAARKAAGYTQEHAAELLSVSVRSLAEYEAGGRIPPNDVVERMVEIYNAQYLAYQHLKATNALAARIIPDIKERSLRELALRIYNRKRRIAKESSIDRLMEIAEDDYIDEQERPEFEEIVSELRELVRSGLELEVYCADRE